MTFEAQKEKIVTAFNQLNKNTIDQLNNFYADDAEFIDPVSHFRGLDRIKKYYANVYKNVESIRFDFKEIQHENQSFYAQWNMTFSAKNLNCGKPFSVEGISVIKFNDQGKVFFHRDYTDLGSMVYERIPLLGSIIRMIKKTMHVDS
jgi:ketosteroid isomerase-like protein